MSVLEMKTILIDWVQKKKKIFNNKKNYNMNNHVITGDFKSIRTHMYKIVY